MDPPPDDDLPPDKFDAMVKRHARQLGEHSLAVVVAIRTEDPGAPGVYFRTAGNHHAAEKAAEDFLARSEIRRDVRFRKEAEAEFGRTPPPDEPPTPTLPGDEWKQ